MLDAFPIIITHPGGSGGPGGSGVAARLAPLVLLGLLVGGCTDPLGPELDALRAAEQRWAASGPSSYSYRIDRLCYCAEADYPVRVVVRNGALESVAFIEPLPGGTEPGWEPEGYVMEDLFALIRRELLKAPADSRALYHSVLGYPVQVFIDYNATTLEDEWAIGIPELEALADA